MNFLIADDHPIFRTGLKDLLLNSFKDLSLTECSSGMDAQAKIAEKQPDLAILDINMPEKNGIDVCRWVKEAGIRTRVIMLTMYRDKEMLKKSLSSGAQGYLLKDFSSEEIIQCIKDVLENKKHVGPSLKDLYAEAEALDKKEKDTLNQLKGLSQAELKILKLIGENHSSREIAELLFLSEKTIENYRSRISQKLELQPKNNSLLMWVAENKSLLASLSEF
jgi:DNA-binding NarL/FixJ family response regulator